MRTSGREQGLQQVEENSSLYLSLRPETWIVAFLLASMAALFIVMEGKTEQSFIQGLEDHTPSLSLMWRVRQNYGSGTVK